MESAVRAGNPVDATAVVLDLRNFTPNLKSGGASFCDLLARIDGVCLDACTASLPPSTRADAPLYTGSTGDGMIAVFLHPDHAVHAYLAALIMQRRVFGLCRSYRPRRGVPAPSYGIGVETGQVRRVSAHSPHGPLLDTVIGDCINVASRAQAIGKHLFRAHTVLGPRVNAQLVKALIDVDYDALVRSASADDDAFLAKQRKMDDINQQLCLTWLHRHILRGVDRPTSLYKVSVSAARPGTPRFDTLLERLTVDAQHHAEVLALFDGE